MKTITIKLPASLKVELDQIRLEFGVPFQHEAVAACIATVAELMREDKLSRLVASDPTDSEE